MWNQGKADTPKNLQQCINFQYTIDLSYGKLNVPRRTERTNSLNTRINKVQRSRCHFHFNRPFTMQTIWYTYHWYYLVTSWHFFSYLWAEILRTKVITHNEGAHRWQPVRGRGCCSNGSPYVSLCICTQRIIRCGICTWRHNSNSVDVKWNSMS